MPATDKKSSKTKSFSGREKDRHLIKKATKYDKQPAAFTPDNRYFFNALNNEVNLYSIATGEVVRTFTFPPPKDRRTEVTAIAVSTLNRDHLIIGSSASASIIVWNYQIDEVVKKLKLTGAVMQIVACDARPGLFLVLTRRPRSNVPQGNESTELTSAKYIMMNKDPDSDLHLLDLRENKFYPLRHIASLEGRQRLAWSPDGDYIALVSEYKLKIGYFKENDRPEFRSFELERKATCLEFHPTEQCIAIGDIAGRITLWYGLDAVDSYDTTQKELHWHSHSVYTVTFTSDGIYLLSGGREAVLVLWHLRSGHKQFLPRLDTDITKIIISPDQAYYALIQADNTIRIINALDLTLRQLIKTLNYANLLRRREGIPTDIAIDPRSQNLVLNGTVGQLQFYNPFTKRHVFDLEVVPHMHLPYGSKAHLTEPMVNHIAFTTNGSWMATVDSRYSKKSIIEPCLKFWFFDPEVQQYVLKTRVDTPHQDIITSLTAADCGDEPVFVTTSKDGRWKAWRLCGPENAKHWMCLSACEYRGMPAYDATFSQDASVLAVAFKDSITLWDPLHATLQGVLPRPAETERIRQLAFVTDSPYLVSITTNHIYVWNLLTCSICWTYRMKVLHLAVNPDASEFAVAGPLNHDSKEYLAVFSPSSPVPQFVRAGKFAAIAYAQQTSSGTSPIIAIDIRDGLQIIHTTTETETATAPAEETALKDVPQPGLFSSIFGQTEKPRHTPQNVDTSQPATTTDNELWTLPAHVMPSVHLMYQHFMNSLLRPATTKSSNDGNTADDTTTEEIPSTHHHHTMDVDVLPPSTDASDIDEASVIKDVHMFDMLSELFQQSLHT